jgi:hypothetical protein
VLEPQRLPQRAPPLGGVTGAAVDLQITVWGIDGLIGDGRQTDEEQCRRYEKPLHGVFPDAQTIDCLFFLPQSKGPDDPFVDRAPVSQ